MRNLNNIFASAHQANVGLRVEVEGEYSFCAVKMDGTKRQLGKTHNIITNWGLNQLATQNAGSFLTSCCLGTGTTPEDASQSRLVAFSYYTSSTITNVQTQGSLANLECSYLRVFRFSPNIAGTFTEVGVGTQSSPTNGFVGSRALIRDDEGNPSSISVLADEYLDVTYTFKIRIPNNAQQTSGNFNIGATSYSYVCKASECALWHASGGNFSSTYAWGCDGYSGTLSANVDGYPTGNPVYFSPAFSLIEPYVDYSYNVKMKATIGLTNGNSYPIKSIWLNAGQTRWQFELNTPIVKNNTQILTLNFEFTWARAT